jgi:hypothetical protein
VIHVLPSHVPCGSFDCALCAGALFDTTNVNNDFTVNNFRDRLSALIEADKRVTHAKDKKKWNNLLSYAMQAIRTLLCEVTDKPAAVAEDKPWEEFALSGLLGPRHSEKLEVTNAHFVDEISNNFLSRVGAHNNPRRVLVREILATRGATQWRRAGKQALTYAIQTRHTQASQDPQHTWEPLYDGIHDSVSVGEKRKHPDQ